ncbi:hypothetical protein SVAN01_00420 [Stagonosporopsis vannaccii]|nr:hypothetical protein SVAN01_00420 [Stagonosporopsis vannaccii]
MTSCPRQFLRTFRPRRADPSERTLSRSQLVLPDFKTERQRIAFTSNPLLSLHPWITAIRSRCPHQAVNVPSQSSRRTFSITTCNMSWMDSWSRPSKSQATPPPLYLTIGDSVPYCHSCGRVIGDRKKTSGATEVKYCSQRCRHQKPGPLDRKIEATFARLLDGATAESIKEEQEQAKSQKGDAKDEGRKSLEKDKDGTADEDDNPKFNKKSKSAHKKKSSKTKNTPKGDHRLTIDCTFVEELFFNREKDPEKVYGRRKNRRARFVVEKPEDWRSVDMVDTPPAQSNSSAPAAAAAHDASSAEDTYSDSEPETGGVTLEAPASAADVQPDAIEYGYGGGKIRPPQDQSDINGSIGGEKGWAERQGETEEARQRRLEGQRRADEREMVRKAARRGVAFGFLAEGDEGVRGGEKGERRKCEAVMKGAVVEASFAKGEWGVRWREKV